MYLIPFIELLASILALSVSTTDHTSYPDINLLPKDWPLFLSHHCGYLCQNGSRIIRQGYPKGGFIPKCFPCDCDENCSLKGTCCPTIDSDNETVSYEMPKSSPNSYLNDIYKRVEFKRVQYKSIIADRMFADLYLTVVQCPFSWKDTDVKQKCEQPTGDSFDSVIPYSDLNSGLVFPNIFCLMCHGLIPNSDKSDDFVRQERLVNSSMLQAWTIYIGCEHQNNLINDFVSDRFQIFKRAASLGECSVRIFPNETRHVYGMCYLSIMSGLELSMTPPCPPEASETLKELCHTLPDIPALRMYSAKNIFCYLCHGSKVKLRNFQCHVMNSYYNGPFSVPADVTVKVKYTREMTVCLPNKWENDEDQCVFAFCPAGKVFVNADTCEALMDDILGEKYGLNVTFVLQETIPHECLIEGKVEIDERLKPLLYFVSSFSHRLKSCFLDDDHTIYKQEVDVWGYYDGKYYISKDDFEGKTVDIFANSSWHLEIVDDENVLHVMQLRPVCLGRDTCDIYRNQSKDENCLQRDRGRARNIYIHNYSDTTTSLTCPYVIVNLTTKPIVVDKNIVFTIAFRNQSIQVIWNSNISIVDNEVRVCSHYFKDLILQFQNSSSKSMYFPGHDLTNTLLAISYFLDIVCIATSCICLMASIMTYLLFPSLRNLPGLNNLCLCLSLLTAQVSLLVTSLLGSQGLLTEIHCLIHAMVLHYSWIASFVWMNTCCIHMYRIFTGHYLESHKRQFLWYFIYSFGSPFFVVVTLITITTVTTTGKSIGYGSDVCFLDTKTSNLIIILGLLAPIGITLLINGILFVLTVKQIVAVTKMQLKRKSTHGVFTYLKLSTVTGAFCFFAAASAQFESPIMFLISSPFAALQGVFIFTSFIVNKRILELYKDLIYCRKKSNSSSQSATNKTKSI